jgi:predicted component of type VI protein secretion system
VHSALALSALRSARRAGDDLEATARATHQAIFDLDAPMAFVRCAASRQGSDRASGGAITTVLSILALIAAITILSDSNVQQEIQQLQKQLQGQ